MSFRPQNKILRWSKGQQRSIVQQDQICDFDAAVVVDVDFAADGHGFSYGRRCWDGRKEGRNERFSLHSLGEVGKLLTFSGVHDSTLCSAMASHSSACSLSSSCVRRGNHSQLSQFSFAYANSGQNLWQSKELPPLRRMETKLRAERVTSRPRREGFESWQSADGVDSGEVEGTSTWDANAENIRRRRSKRVYYSRPEEADEEPSPSMRERDDISDNFSWDNEGKDRSGKSWWDFGGNNRYDNKEWDYETEPNRAQTKAEGWQWWFAENSDDAYGEDDGYEEEDNWLSWLNVDIKDALMLLRWGLPAAFLLCTAVIPVMIGNPLMLLFGFTIFPTVVKYLNPLVKDFFSSAANPFGSSSSTRTKKRRQSASAYSRLRQATPNYADSTSAYSRRSQDTPNYDDSASPYSRRSQDTPKYTDFGSPSTPINRSYDSAVPRQNVPFETSDLGGWDDLVEDRYRSKAESQWPLQRRSKSGKKLTRTERPLVIRIILAFFPFLRGWAGLF